MRRSSSGQRHDAHPEGTEPLNNHLLMTNQEGYRTMPATSAPYDPEAAKQLLEDAGYTLEGEGDDLVPP